ncbi:MAG: pyridoxamine 5'-phosphate oxidase [Bacteroidota bacterium]
MNNRKKLFDLRKEYTQGGLSLSQVLPNPLSQFSLWFNQAVFSGLAEPNAMTLSTATPNGRVSARTVLLKEIDDRGLVFYTNYNSRKAKDIEKNPFGAILFLWLELERQVRVEGIIEKVSEQESDEYFASRPRESQLGAWASDQSQEVSSREQLFARYAELEKIYKGKDIPRPAHWGGYRLIPEEVEFWQGRPGRMHDRILFTLGTNSNGWQKKRLAP